MWMRRYIKQDCEIVSSMLTVLCRSERFDGAVSLFFCYYSFLVFCLSTNYFCSWIQKQ